MNEPTKDHREHRNMKICIFCSANELDGALSILQL